MFANLVLASASPRRHELLRQIGIRFEIVVSDVPEIHNYQELPQDYAVRNALQKATTAAKTLVSNPNTLVLGVDTIVLLTDNTILEKPKDKSHARTMLLSLNGNTHKVLSAFCILDANNLKSLDIQTVITEVTFINMSMSDIENYIDTPEPYDKSGGYSIQGMGSAFVQKIKGSYSNVVGLPLPEVIASLRQHYSFDLFKM